MVWVQFASNLGGVGDGLEVARSLGKLPVDVNKLLGFSCDASRREAERGVPRATWEGACQVFK